MKKADYSSKLLDPRWQKKRLEVLSRDDFMCQICHCKTDELHVHHLVYRKNTEPWEYQIYELITLCKTCHALEIEDIESLFAQLAREAIRYFGRCAGVFANDVEGIIGNAKANEEYEPMIYHDQFIAVFDSFLAATKSKIIQTAFREGREAAELDAKKKQAEASPAQE